MNSILRALQGDRSVYLDIETFGLSKSDPVHEIGILDNLGNATEIIPPPMGVRSLDPSVDPLRASVDKRQIDTWADWRQALAAHPDSYAEKHKSRYPHLTSETPDHLPTEQVRPDCVCRAFWNHACAGSA